MPAPGRFEMGLSAAIHVLVVAVFWISSFERTPDILWEAVAITVVSPPAQEEGPPEPVIVEADFQTIEEPEPDPQEDEAPIEVEEEVAEEDPPPIEEDTPPPTPPDSTDEEPETPKSSNPDPDVTDPGEDINVRMEGLQRDFPVYYRQIVSWIERCFDWNGDPGLEAVVQFEIARDGGRNSLENIVERSRNNDFNRAAMKAVECAVSPDRIGPLPEEMEWDILPVRFRFKGRGVPMGFAREGR